MQSLLAVMKALSDRNRFRVVAALQAHDELCACQITELLQVSGATVSRHMGILVQAGLVEARKAGRWTHFRLIAPPAPHIQPILVWLKAGTGQCPDVDRDRRALEAILSQEKEVLCRRQRGAACCPPAPDAGSDVNVQTKEA